MARRANEKNTSSLISELLEPINKILAKRKDAEDFFVNRPFQAIIDGYEKGITYYEAPELNLEYFKNMGVVLGKKLNFDFLATPSLRCILPEGHRLQLNYGDSIESQIALSIRISSNRRFSLEDFSIDEELKKKLIQTIIKKKAILIVGSTGSGKTQLLNALIKYIPEEERVLSNEDAYEIDFSHLKNYVKTTSNPLMATAEKGLLSTQTLIDDFGRHRPDRLTMGELNSVNSVFMLQLLNSGHGGVITTIHADSVDRGIEKLVQNIMSVNKQTPEFILGSLKEGLGAIIFVTRDPRTYKRQVSQTLFDEQIKQYELPMSNSLNIKLVHRVLHKIDTLLDRNG